MKTKTISIRSKKSIPIWDLFFAAQFLWPEHFLHSITDDAYGSIYALNNKTKKN